jgi:putative ABC transport system permease protein
MNNMPPNSVMKNGLARWRDYLQGSPFLSVALGLFGLASFMAEQRFKEIGVRKILGASVLNLWGLLSKDFTALVLNSLFIATPVGGYFMRQWLQHYTYHAEVENRMII